MPISKDFGNDPCGCESFQNEIQYLKEKLEDCKNQKHEDCKKQKEEANAKIAILQKKLVMVQIAAAVAITVIGKEMVDKITESFSSVKEVQNIMLDGASEKRSGGDDAEAVEKNNDDSSRGGFPSGDKG
jgi:hypothetical protein